MSLKKPNYTQIPNVLFDEMMEDMGLAELKVTLAIFRYTFGYHRERVRLSITKLQKITGLGRGSIIKGAAQAVKRGVLIQNKDGQVTAWMVNLVNQSVNLVNQTGKVSEPPSIKNNSKETIKRKDMGAERTQPEKKRDPLLDNPAVIAYRDVIHLQAHRLMRSKIADVIGLEIIIWKMLLEDWIGMGWKPTNIKGMLDAFPHYKKHGQFKPLNNGSKLTTYEKNVLAFEEGREP